MKIVKQALLIQRAFLKLNTKYQFNEQLISILCTSKQLEKTILVSDYSPAILL